MWESQVLRAVAYYEQSRKTTMNFKDAVRSEVAESNANNNSNEQEELEQIDVDMGNIPFVKFTPTTLVSGTFPENEGNPIILFKNYDQLSEYKDNGVALDENGNDYRWASTRYLGLVMDDVTIHTDDAEGMSEATFVETGSDDSTAYRGVNFDDPKTSYKYDGAAVDVDGDVYDVEGETTTIDGRAIVVVDRTAHTSVASKLDKNGAEAAGMDEQTGQVNDGLFEYVPDDSEFPESMRYSRPFVELRDEFYGQEVGIMVTRRSEVDEDYAELVANGDARDMMWYSVFDIDNEETVEPTTGDPIVGSYLHWNFDPEVGSGDRLPEDQYEFVEQYAESDNSTDEATIRAAVEANADSFESDPNADRIVELIQA